nr:hypothetical protein [Alteromonas profundi]
MFRVAPHKQFGESTEGLTGRSELFNEAEELVAEAESAEEAMSYNRKNPARKPLPKDFPREVIVRDITDDEKYVIVVRMNFIALVKISQRSFSLSPLR